ncbi:hypothetical protein SAMN04488518_107141 [Pseudovibrio ascidiaceicola]|uniref:Uncharacterized protein n=1 Tax=Pseudovibrio ascidiaceicola TaxID=285279 RepID=A0A1I4B4N6_9HYPH|nr:hypothetical protein SAMN04488518_107141 [Pseudovibrio ascidiaceicola]
MKLAPAHEICRCPGLYALPNLKLSVHASGKGLAFSKKPARFMNWAGFSHFILQGLQISSLSFPQPVLRGSLFQPYAS